MTGPVIDGFAQACSLNLARYPLAAGHSADTAPVEQLLITMGVAGVAGAVLVQPDWYGPDHRYLLAAAAMYPEHVRLVCRAGSDAICRDEVIGARFLAGDLTGDATALRTVEELGKLIYAPFGAAPIRLASARRQIIETPSANLTAALRPRLIELLGDARVTLLVKAARRPPADLPEVLDALLATYGPDRLAWGSGFPVAMTSAEYGDAIAPLSRLGGGGQIWDSSPT